jgi:signal transduction histidine kinase
MGEFLKRAGYSVSSAADYESAVIHRVENFDVAVVDINLPGKNGIQLLQKICNADVYVPVIMITGEPNLSVVPEIVRAGAYDFIAKPIVKDVLLNAVGRAADKKRLFDEKRRLEQEIKEYAQELEARVEQRTAELVETHQRLVTQERIAALGRAAAQVAHEVKNPLAGLLLYSLHLKSKATSFSESETYLVDKIVETIKHLNSRVEQILDFARPVRLNVRPSDLTRMVNDVLALIRPQLTGNKVEVRLSTDQQPAIGMFDDSSIRGALLNVMLNAIEAMPSGGTLGIHIGRTPEMLLLEITDTGRGITEEEANKIFEPFYTTKAQGLGLGMPYARKMIEQHGGSISLTSRHGEGTKVFVSLPAAQKEDENAS